MGEAATDVPSWAKGNRPYKGESGKEFAKRLLDEKYGMGNYEKGPASEFNKIKSGEIEALNKQEVEFQEELYLVSFKQNHRLYYALWYTSDKDGFILNENDRKIRLFVDESDAARFAFQNNYLLYADVTEVPCDEAELLDLSEPNCVRILTFWNIISDAANSLGLFFMGDSENEEVWKVYEKLFYGCNLPAIRQNGEDYKPIWQNNEKK